MANETNNLMQALDAQVIAEFEASLSEDAKADWSKAIESCGGDSKKIAEVTSNYRNSAYAYVSGKVEYACEQSGASDKHQTAYNFAQQKETERDRILYGEGYGNAFKENVTGLDDVIDKNGKVERKGLRTQYAEAEAGNNTTLMEALNEQIKAREAELEKVNNELAYWQAEDFRAYQQLESRDNRLDLLRAVQNGDQEAAKAAMLKEIEAFDNVGTPSINSADDASKWQTKHDEINKYKEYLGIEPDATVTEKSAVKQESTATTMHVSDTTTAETSAAQEIQLTDEEMRKAIEDFDSSGSPSINSQSDYERYQAKKAEIDAYREQLGMTTETADAKESNVAASAPNNEEHIDNKKPNPYAFERPENMTDDEYALAEAEHIDNVNRQAAADINAGKYGNGEDRKKALAEAGLDYDAVQSIINNEYVPKYEAERAKQAEAAAKQAAAGPSDADIDAALAEAENNNKKIEIKTEASVKDEVEAIKADVTATFDSQKTPAGEAQAMAKALERKAQEGRPLTDEELKKYKSESVAEMGDDFSFEPKESSVEDELAAVKADVKATFDAQRTPLGEAQAVAKVLERKALENMPWSEVPEDIKKEYEGYSVPMDDSDYSFEPEGADEAENTIPGVEYDENGEAVVIHGDEPVPAQDNKKSGNKVVKKDYSGATNLYNGSQSGNKSAEFENQQ